MQEKMQAFNELMNLYSAKEAKLVASTEDGLTMPIVSTEGSEYAVYDRRRKELAEIAEAGEQTDGASFHSSVYYDEDLEHEAEMNKSYLRLPDERLHKKKRRPKNDDKLLKQEIQDLVNTAKKGEADSRIFNSYASLPRFTA